jgi:hypothetical protein
MRTAGVVQAIGRSLCKREPLSSNPSPTKKKEQTLTRCIPEMFCLGVGGWGELGNNAGGGGREHMLYSSQLTQTSW